MNRSLFLMLVLSGAACGSPSATLPARPSAAATRLFGPAQATDDAHDDFRKAPPPSENEVEFVPPRIEEAHLENGLRILLVERHDLPVVAVQIVTNQGADQGAPGVGAFVGAMLSQGTKKRSAIDLSDAMGQLGASFESSVGFDGGGVSAKALATHFPKLLELLADMVRNPAFEKAEVERERALRLTAVAQQKDRPSVVLSNALGELLYPKNHPYHVPLLGDEAAIKAVSPASLQQFHRAHFEPSALTVAICGNATMESAKAELNRVFGSWKGSTGKRRDTTSVPATRAASTGGGSADCRRPAEVDAVTRSGGACRCSSKYQRL